MPASTPASTTGTAPAIAFDNSYARLPERFHARLDPTPVAEPRLIALNDGLAGEMGLDPDALRAMPEVFAGNAVPEGAEPLAQAYAGHQFGGWVPRLGDGRAHLLGEVVGPDGRRWDLQLKGSGPTPFSRMGDGRAWLGPVLREYVVSEAMAAMGVPTTRALAAAATGETVLRERPLPGAVLTRVAPSHIRVGTFQYFAARGDVDALERLAAMAIERHHPDADGPMGLLRAAVAAQAELIAHWMALGFVHGVMNTDNAHVGGITIDYGPCAFMDAYHPGRVFSSIDQMGRYAYANQPRIAAWNMAQLATCLLPLMGGEAAVEEATEVVNGFADAYASAQLRRFRAKLGLASEREGDAALIADLLDRMAAGRADFTLAFRGLADDRAAAAFEAPEALGDWPGRHRARRAEDEASDEEARALMRAASPAAIPRNHRVEALIASAVSGDMAPFHEMLEAMAAPFEDGPLTAAHAAPPAPKEVVTATFCGT